jgi:hypothetical protein
VVDGTLHFKIQGENETSQQKQKRNNNDLIQVSTSKEELVSQQFSK